MVWGQPLVKLISPRNITKTQTSRRSLELSAKVKSPPSSQQSVVFACSQVPEDIVVSLIITFYVITCVHEV